MTLGGERMTDNASASSRPLKPFTGTDSTRNYRAMYRAACNFHEKHNPPPGMDSDAYWDEVGADMLNIAKQFDCDKFMIALLWAVADELAREAKVRQSQW